MIGLALVVLFAIRQWQGTEPSYSPHNLPATTELAVRRVVDGDTILFEPDMRVRLIGVNSPESVKPDSPVEPFGPEASQFTKEFVRGGVGATRVRPRAVRPVRPAAGLRLGRRPDAQRGAAARGARPLGAALQLLGREEAALSRRRAGGARSTPRDLVVRRSLRHNKSDMSDATKITCPACGGDDLTQGFLTAIRPYGGVVKIAAKPKFYKLSTLDSVQARKCNRCGDVRLFVEPSKPARG